MTQPAEPVENFPQADSPFLSSSSSNSSDHLSDNGGGKDRENRKRRGKGRRNRSRSNEAFRDSVSQRSASDRKYRRQSASVSRSPSYDGDARRKRDRRDSRSRSRDRQPSYGGYRQNDERDNNQNRGYGGYQGGNTRPQYGSQRPTRGNHRGFRPERDGEFLENGVYLPRLSKPLVPYQQFASMQNRRIQDLTKEYEKYKETHHQNHSKAFLKEHEDDSWFLEKYDPLTKFNQWEKTVAKAKSVLPNDDYIDPNEWTVCLKSVPVWVSRQMLQQTMHNADVYFSEPLKMSHFDRICWVKFQNQDQYNQALSQPVQLNSDNNDHQRMNQTPSRANLVAKGVKQTPPLTQQAEERDLQLATSCIEVLDQEYGTKFTPYWLSASLDKLNSMVKYMWKVFGYAFYAGVRCEDERSVALKCFRYERSQSVAETQSEFESSYVQFAEALVQQGPQSTQLQDPQEDPLLKELKTKFCIKNCQEISAEKFKCEICGKGFCGQEFVIKHINIKHEEWVYEKVSQKHFRQQKRDAYIRDKDRIENAPIAHSFSNFAANGGNRKPYVAKPRQEDANGGGQEPAGEMAEAPVKKEYIDYDDPMSSQLREVKKQQVAFGGPAPKQERVTTSAQQINYDDLF